MSIREVVVRSLGEFVDVVTPREPDRQTGRRRDTGVYRGASRSAQPLLTTLDKLGGIDPPHTKVDLEEHILRNFIRYSRPHLDQARSHNGLGALDRGAASWRANASPRLDLLSARGGVFRDATGARRRGT